MLDEHGFRRKTYAEILEEMEAKAKELFGDDIQTTSHSALGIFLRVVAWFLSLAQELAERVYNSGFISKATGVQLDRLGSNNGITRNPAMPALVTLEFTGKEGFVIEEGVQFKTSNDIIFEMIDVVTLDADGKGSGQAVSAIYSSKANVPANAITVIAEPAEDLYTVTNPVMAAGGSELETDSDFRERIRVSLRANPGPPANGIITALSEVSSVRSASVVENNTMITDVEGNPAKSVHVYCFGGIKEDIGNAVFESVAAGIETIGEQAVTVKDLSGFEHVVKFDYAESTTIFAEVDVTVTASFPETGVNDIKQAVYNYINGLNMGETVVHSFMYPGIYAVEGVKIAIVKIGKTKASVASQNIVISSKEVAQTTFEQIEVIVKDGS